MKTMKHRIYNPAAFVAITALITLIGCFAGLPLNCLKS
jgi:hypothetical protein